MPLGYVPNPLPPAKGLEGEDNYQILVYDRKGGELLGVAARTSMVGAIRAAWREAIEKYPGHYLLETNGPYIIREVTTPTGEADQSGLIKGGDVRLQDLPQWYGLMARCPCGYTAPIDRYAPRIAKWKGYPLTTIAEKLSCIECKKAGRPKPTVALDLYKLAR